MTKAIVIEQYGGVEVLEIKKINLTKPQTDQVLINQTAIGINFSDISYRKGIRSVGSLPLILGLEACGYIEEVGPAVDNFKVGDRVAYATAPIGAYCEQRIMNTKYLVSIPDSISDNQVAAILRKGLVAHYLLRRTYYLKPQNTVLIHAAAGGIGSLLSQWAHYIGATIIGTVGSDSKIAAAKANGCDYVLNHQDINFVSQVIELTKGRGVDVVYDSIGISSLMKSSQSLAKFGLLISFGDSSGLIESITPQIYKNNSIFFTAPSLADYKDNQLELVLSANEVFKLLEKKNIKDNITKVYQLDEIRQAHQDMEQRLTTGSIIIKL